MKTILRISLISNLLFLGGLICFLSNPHKSAATFSPVRSNTRPVMETKTIATNPASVAQSRPFRWSQLEPGKDYRAYIANLRGIGCPESTVEDIVRGDAERTFAWEHQQLNLDGTGSGPWSKSSEMKLVADLLGLQHTADRVTAQTETGSAGSDEDVTMNPDRMDSPSCPLFLQNPNWAALGFTPDQQAVIAHVRQQFESEIGGANQNPGSPPNQVPDKATRAGSLPSSNSGNQSPAQWQQALGNADNQLRDLLGAQGYMAYEQQQYNQWYQPQVVAADASAENLTINPGAFSPK